MNDIDGTTESPGPDTEDTGRVARSSKAWTWTEHGQRKAVDRATPGDIEQAATRTAWIAGLFVVVVCVLMATNHVRSRVADPLDSKEHAALRKSLTEKPRDEELKTRVRELDLELRREYVQRQSFAARGTYLLLAGAVVWLVAAKIAAGCRKKPPMPQTEAGEPGEQARAAASGRLAVTVIGSIVGVCALAWAITSSGVLEDLVEQQRPKFPTPEEIAQNWPRFRGPGGSGVSAYANAPISWNGETGEGVLWKAEVPLAAPNSPLVWGDRVFLTGATEKMRREVYCYDANTGGLLWTWAVENVPGASSVVPEVMEDVGHAAATGATDGYRVYSIFANGDVVCFDYQGERVWARSLGVPDNSYGHASSLVQAGHLLLVLYDQASEEDGKSRLIALNAASGSTVWETRRAVGATWSTPIVIGTEKGEQIITTSIPFVHSYDLATGAEIWRAECMGGEIAPAPVFAGGLVYVANSGAFVAAINPNGRGNVTKTHIIWKAEEGLPDISSPVSNGELLFLLASNGTLTCYDAKEVKGGKFLWQKELKAACSASPSIAGDRLYVITEKGTAIICRVAREYEEIARAELGEKCRASAAFTDGRIYIRGVKNLYCIGEK